MDKQSNVFEIDGVLYESPNRIEVNEPEKGTLLIGIGDNIFKEEFGDTFFDNLIERSLNDREFNLKETVNTFGTIQTKMPLFFDHYPIKTQNAKRIIFAVIYLKESAVPFFLPLVEIKFKVRTVSRLKRGIECAYQKAINKKDKKDLESFSSEVIKNCFMEEESRVPVKIILGVRNIKRPVGLRNSEVCS